VNGRTLVVIVAALALATPVAATARTVPPRMHLNAVAEKHLVTTGALARKPVVAKAAKRKVAAKAPRILCICVVYTRPGSVPITQDEFERLVDEDMVAHGLEPVYGTTSPARTAAG